MICGPVISSTKVCVGSDGSASCSNPAPENCEPSTTCEGTDIIDSWDCSNGECSYTTSECYAVEGICIGQGYTYHSGGQCSEGSGCVWNEEDYKNIGRLR